MTRPEFVLTVFGVPCPQGSKSKGRYGNLYESSRGLPAWRKQVTDEAFIGRRGKAPMFAGPVELELFFTIPKPKSRPRISRCDRKPDLDKLCRAVMDSMTQAGIWKDDSKVVKLTAEKTYPADKLNLQSSFNVLERPGVFIVVRSA